ncbi:glycosyltransferase [Desulfamplus magnetovallimortis]|nr:glycosyltransferase [Desulfamplus magnetovallimortis]
MKKKRIKVAFIFGALGGGGAQRQFGHLINNINRERFRPIIISIGRSENETIAFFKKYTDEQIEIDPQIAKVEFQNYYLYRNLKYKEDIYFISKYENSKFKIQKLLYKLFQKLKPDIALSISPYAAALSIFPLVLNRTKHRIHSVRSNEMLFEHKKSISNYFHWFTKHLISLYIVNSNDLKTKMKLNGFKHKEIINIYNGIPVFYDLIQKKNDDVIKISYIARLYKVKNHQMLFDAILSISTNNEFRVHIFGTGVLEHELKEYVNKYKLSHTVIFEGWKKDISKYLQETDIVVLTSNGEGFNNSIAEAQMHAIPVVSTDCTGSREIVINGVTGFVVNVDDTKSFAEKLQILIDNDSLRNAYGKRAYTRSRNMFTIKNMIKNYEALFASLMN